LIEYPLYGRIDRRILHLNAARMYSGYWYIASPFDKIDKEIARREAMKCVAYLWNRNIFAWSPIAHSAGIEKYLPKEKLNHEFMLHADATLLGPSVGTIFFLLKGWKNSEGMIAEYDYTRDSGKPYYSLPHEWVTEALGDK